MEVIDNGAEVWLSKGLMKMYINQDYENGIDLARRHNTLGVEVVKFNTAREAIEHKESCAAIGDDSETAGMDLGDFEVHGAGSAPSRLSAEERRAGAATPASPVAPPAAAASHEVLHPDSKVDAMRARLRELDMPIYGTKEVLWTRLGRAERVNREHKEKLAELRRRHEQAVEERPQIAP
jgi:hypothetical protein